MPESPPASRLLLWSCGVAIGLFPLTICLAPGDGPCGPILIVAVSWVGLHLLTVGFAAIALMLAGFPLWFFPRTAVLGETIVGVGAGLGCILGVAAFGIRVLGWLGIFK